jgi:2-succinyl-6-hydroxy-2,4-cyclohexadiene-1-carboxylate synthase
MRGLGAGEMQPLWDRLPELAMPVTMLVGERDGKFLTLGRRMAELLPAGDLVIVPGGHGLPLENPAAIVEALR